MTPDIGSLIRDRVTVLHAILTLIPRAHLFEEWVGAPAQYEVVHMMEQASLDKAFHSTNNIDSSWNGPDEPRRSTSVGDLMRVVTKDDVEDVRWFVVASFGFTELTPEKSEEFEFIFGPSDEWIPEEDDYIRNTLAPLELSDRQQRIVFVARSIGRPVMAVRHRARHLNLLPR